MPTVMRRDIRALHPTVAAAVARDGGSAPRSLARSARQHGLSFCQTAFLVRELAGFERSATGFRLAEQAVLSEPAWEDVRLTLARRNDLVWDALELD